MKNTFLILLATLVMAGTSHATLIFDESFDYPDGPLVSGSGGVWLHHSGNTPDEVQVADGKITVTFHNTEDVNRPLNDTYTEGTLYASFVVNFSELPGSSGSYFAHFNSSSFKGRIFATTAGAADGQFRVGVANGDSNPDAVVPTDLSLGQDYLLVLRMDVNPVASTLWLNPNSEGALNDRADATDDTDAAGISAFAFREASGMGTMTVDNLKVGTAFSDVAEGGNTTTNPPVVSVIEDQSIPANSSTAAIDFTVNDGETSPDNLIVTATSSNPALVPNDPANIALDGVGTDRTITISPATDQQGSATITITVEDADNNTAMTSFVVVVGAPTISAIPNQFTRVATPTAELAFTIGDVETPAENLNVSGSSSNPTLVSAGNFTFGGSGANRTVIVTPAAGQSGFAIVTVSVSDGVNTADTSFALSVNPLTGTDLVDDFTYADGPITITSSGIWANHSGTTEELQVLDGKLQLSQFQGEDVNALFFGGLPYGFYGTNEGYVIYSSFAVRFTELPAGEGSYFAHLKDNGNFNFRARVFATTNGASPGYYRLGISDGSSSVSALAPTDLALEDTVIVTTRYVVDTGECVLWVNAQSEADASVAATDETLPVDIWAFAFRQSSGIGVLSVDDLLTGGTFADVFQQPPPPNTSPTISVIDDQVTDLNGLIGPLAFTIDDAETAVANLDLSVRVNNDVLFPPGSIVFGGSGANRTVTLTPATDESGSAQIVVTVTDEGTRTASTSFQVTVLAPNNPPLISEIPNQQTPMDTATAPIPFVIGDPESAVEDLTLSVSSSEPTIIPEANILLNGSGSNWTVTVTPAAGQLGVATIGISVSDGVFTTTTNFLLTVTLRDLLVEPFDYPDGSVVDGSSLWSTHSGTTGQVQVVSGKLEITEAQSEDINAPLAGAPYDPSSGLNLYVSFAVNFSELPGSGSGNYFAHFKDDGSGFRAKIYANTDNAGTDMFRLGIINVSGAPVQFPLDLSLGTTYLVVVRYNVETASSVLWVNPTSEADPGAVAIDSGATSVIVTSFAFRESGNIGAMAIDDLVVATTFEAVLPEPGVSLTIQAPAGGGLEISWPAAATADGYMLQSTTALPGGWADYSDQGTAVDGRQTVTISAPTGNRFFQLINR